MSRLESGVPVVFQRASDLPKQNHETVYIKKIKRWRCLRCLKEAKQRITFVEMECR